MLVHDELGLPALPFQWYDTHAGGLRGHGRPQVPADHVQAHVQPGGRAREVRICPLST